VEEARGDVQVLLAALEARDPSTARHSRAVIDLAERVALRLGLSEEAVEEAVLVAALQDVGKIALPDRVLHQHGLLDDIDRSIMRDHPAAGAHLLLRIPGLAYLAEAVRATHERWDGEGYPDRLAGEDIPLASRIVFVCDAYNAMISPRPYRSAMTQVGAMFELARCQGTQFCPDCTAALLSVLELEHETMAALAP
jgi:HD-GYP domain-containing protein (c-di-GMP phosphodiesterase class II)